jgi:hypothetical protein
MLRSLLRKRNRFSTRLAKVAKPQTSQMSTLKRFKLFKQMRHGICDLHRI